MSADDELVYQQIKNSKQQMVDVGAWNGPPSMARRGRA
jgi:hypothetical protein